MACVDLPANADSEMEEGEIVDEVDYLSDISSEEEFLLRQRLKVLENYNNALERKEAKKSTESGKKKGKKDTLYSDISATEVPDKFLKTKFVITKDKKYNHKPVRPRRVKQNDRDGGRNRDYHKKKYRSKNKIDGLSDSVDSDASDDDIKTKRRKLADAVALNIVKHDTTSTLKERLTKMLGIANTNDCGQETVISDSLNEENNKLDEERDKLTSDANIKQSEDLVHSEIIEVKIAEVSNDTVDSPCMETKEENNNSQENSDEDLELLRQHALKTKSSKTKTDQQKSTLPENRIEPQSEDEDSDTQELRLICLKSTLLKKAIEMKQKQKLQKRLSNSNMHDFDICGNDGNVDNNTDIESVDMEIGSDAEDKGKELIHDYKNNSEIVNGLSDKNMRKEDELEEDEDLLRAKLLTSLSKNLPNLVDIKVLDSAFAKEDNKKVVGKKVLTKKISPQPSVNVEEKKFIIQLGESDSEAENEATKNLTKMHQKLSEQTEFQMKLDQFLKSTRMEVEKTKLPDVVQEPVVKPPEKFVPKTMNHLPKSEQIEYRNLVKRMAELEKMKQARQHAINMNSKINNTPKDTLKPRNFAMNTYKVAFAKKLEEKIALSRKHIAEESAKMLKLKEEATNLTQRYKIVATELKNIATAITLNKKQQKTVQNGLNKIRNQHQMLLKSAPSKHSNQRLNIGKPLDAIIPTVRLQKENEPLKDPIILKSDKISFVNDNKKEDSATNPSLVIQVDISSNKKIVKLPKSPTKDKADTNKNSPKKSCVNEKIESTELSKYKDNKICIEKERLPDELQDDFDDYKSPLDALKSKNWEEDPNAVLCPFEFGGSCRDSDCKYLHPKILKQE